MIQVNNLCKTYGKGQAVVRAVRDVCLKVEDGGYLAVMGASGSGKTTLMNILGCLDTQTSGDYIFAGTNVKRLSKQRKVHLRNKKIGFIFQSFYLLPSLTAKQNIELPMVYAGVSTRKRHDKSAELLELTGLSSRATHLPSQLSGGQCQRVAIARALVNNPDLILADEPTGNLDSRTGYEIIQILRRLNEIGTTIILITHERAIADTAKNLIELRDGQIIKEYAV